MEEGSRGGGGDNTILEKRVDGLSPGSTAKVVKILRRGSWTSGVHQELLCQLESGAYIRLSRTNGEDTIQYGASLTHGTSPLPTIEEAKLVGKTLGDVCRAFYDVHDQWPRYEQADCQTFAGEIWNRLLGIESEDDFM